MTEEQREDQLAIRVYRLIKTFVNLKTEEKSGEKYKDFAKKRGDNNRVMFPETYRETREKICSEAFLAMRGRREQDFVEYFTGTICSVPHFMPKDDFLAVADALMGNWEKVKVFSMLALSAHSYLSDNPIETTSEKEVQ